MKILELNTIKWQAYLKVHVCLIRLYSNKMPMLDFLFVAIGKWTSLVMCFFNSLLNTLNFYIYVSLLNT